MKDAIKQALKLTLENLGASAFSDSDKFKDVFMNELNVLGVSSAGATESTEAMYVALFKLDAKACLKKSTESDLLEEMNSNHKVEKYLAIQTIECIAEEYGCAVQWKSQPIYDSSIKINSFPFHFVFDPKGKIEAKYCADGNVKASIMRIFGVFLLIRIQVNYDEVGSSEKKAETRWSKANVIAAFIMVLLTALIFLLGYGVLSGF